MNELYFIREPRTGGSLFESVMRNKVGDKFNCHTNHNLQFIKTISVNPNTIVLRSARKNLTEHFLSMRFLQDFPKTSNFTNLTNDKSKNYILELMLQHRIKINRLEIIDWLDGKILDEIVFQNYAKNFKHQTVFYEDMCNPIDIPILDLHKIVFFDNKDYTIKLPDYKKEVFTNYDQVAKWMESSLNALTKKYNTKEFLKYWTSHSGS